MQLNGYLHKSIFFSQEILLVSAYLYGGGGPQVGEVTRLGGVALLSIYIVSRFNLIVFHCVKPVKAGSPVCKTG